MEWLKAKGRKYHILKAAQYPDGRTGLYMTPCGQVYWPKQVVDQTNNPPEGLKCRHCIAAIKETIKGE